MVQHARPPHSVLDGITLSCMIRPCRDVKGGFSTSLLGSMYDAWTGGQRGRDAWSRTEQLDPPCPPLEFNGVGSGNDPGGVSVLVGHFQRSGLFELSLNLGAIAFGGEDGGTTPSA